MSVSRKEYKQGKKLKYGNSNKGIVLPNDICVSKRIGIPLTMLTKLRMCYYNQTELAAGAGIQIMPHYLNSLFYTLSGTSSKAWCIDELMTFYDIYTVYASEYTVFGSCFIYGDEAANTKYGFEATARPTSILNSTTTAFLVETGARYCSYQYANMVEEVRLNGYVDIGLLFGVSRTSILSNLAYSSVKNSSPSSFAYLYITFRPVLISGSAFISLLNYIYVQKQYVRLCKSNNK